MKGIREEVAIKCGVKINMMLPPTLMAESAMTATLSKTVMIVPTCEQEQ